MRLALAIASFIILIVHGVVFYNQFFHKWENYQTAYFDQAKSLAKTAPENESLESRRPRIEQYHRHPVRRYARRSLRHLPHRHGRSALRGTRPAAAGPSVLQALGDSFVNGKWERRHKFTDFGCTVCHDGQGRGLKNRLQPRRGRVLAGAAPGLRHAGELAQGVSSPSQGQRVHAGQLRAVPHRRKLSPAPRWCTRAASCSSPATATAATASKDSPKAPSRPTSPKPARSSKWTTCGNPSSTPRANLATSFMPKFNLNEDEVKALVVFLKSRRGMNFAETSHRALPRAPERQRQTDGRDRVTAPKLTGAALVAHGEQADSRPRLHGLPQARRTRWRYRARPEL